MGKIKVTQVLTDDITTPLEIDVDNIVEVGSCSLSDVGCVILCDNDIYCVLESENNVLAMMNDATINEK